MAYFEDQNFFSNAGVGKINKNLNIEFKVSLISMEEHGSIL